MVVKLVVFWLPQRLIMFFPDFLHRYRRAHVDLYMEDVVQ